MQNTRRIPVAVDPEVYISLKEYSEQTHVPITEVVAEALTDWLETVGAARLESIQQTRTAFKNVLTFPAEPGGDN